MEEIHAAFGGDGSLGRWWTATKTSEKKPLFFSCQFPIFDDFFIHLPTFFPFLSEYFSHILSGKITNLILTPAMFCLLNPMKFRVVPHFSKAFWMFSRMFQGVVHIFHLFFIRFWRFFEGFQGFYTGFGPFWPGQCGSCWSFGATSALDSRLCIATNGVFSGPEAQLSRGFVASCAPPGGRDGCGGGWSDWVFDLMANTGNGMGWSTLW